MNIFGNDPDLEEIREGIDRSRLEDLKGRPVLVKYGGNAMEKDELKEKVLHDVSILHHLGIKVAVVHGGGPIIQKLMDAVDLRSEFVSGHRKTTPETMKYVEMALKGSVNGELVSILGRNDLKAVGLSGKDGRMAIAEKRLHYEEGEDGRVKQLDLGQVGDIKRIDPTLVTKLLEEDYIPVIAPIAIGEDNLDYNVNADMFAGHMAGAIDAKAFIALTDVNGLLRDPQKEDSRYEELTTEETEPMMGHSIKGGMLPKVEAANIAIKNGVASAYVINGTRPHSLLKELLTQDRSGTRISR